jgi:hypothetical protein
LERHEDPLLSTLFGRHAQEILSAVQDLAAGNFVEITTREDLSQGALTRPIRPHDGMQLARTHCQIDATQDLPAGHARVQVLDFK